MKKIGVLMLLNLIFFKSIALADGHHHHHGHETLKPAAQQALDGSIYGVAGVWENQRGEKFQLTNIAGKPHVFAMLYTKCETACPILVEDVRKVVSALPKDQQNIPVVLFSIDAEGETLKSLQSFVETKKLPAHWQVARANTTDVATLAAVLGVSYKRLPDGEYVHSNSIFFVDQEGVLVGQQDGLNKLDEFFIKAIKASLVQEHKGEGFWNKIKKYLGIAS